MKKRSTYNSKTALILTIILSTLVFTGVESFAVQEATGTSSQKSFPMSPTAGTDKIPENSKIFAPQTAEKAEKTENFKKDGKAKTAAEDGILPIKENSPIDFKVAIFKFLKAMVGVLISSLAIFGGLKLYKMIVSKKTGFQNNKKTSSSLDTPKNFKEALNSFLDKTDK